LVPGQHLPAWTSNNHARTQRIERQLQQVAPCLRILPALHRLPQQSLMLGDRVRPFPTANAISDAGPSLTANNLSHNDAHQDSGDRYGCNDSHA